MNHDSRFVRFMMTASNGSIFHVTGPLWGKSTGYQWIPFIKASDAKLWCFLWCAPAQTVHQIIEMPVIWDAHSDVIEWQNTFLLSEPTACQPSIGCRLCTGRSVFFSHMHRHRHRHRDTFQNTSMYTCIHTYIYTCICAYKRTETHPTDVT